MVYMTALEAAKKWGVSLRYVQALCQKEKIPGATRMGRDWMIPEDATRPVDGRTKAGKAGADAQKKVALPFPRSTPFLHMTDLYSKPGSAEESARALDYHKEGQLLFSAGIAYSQGQIEKVYESANYLLSKHTDFYSTISAGMLLALCAIWQGDLTMWRRAKVHIAEAPAKTDMDRDIMSLSITAVDSMLYDVSSFPEWFKIGCFEPLHKDALPAANVFYAKYLYAAAYALATKEIEVQGMQGLSLMTSVPYTLEPMISYARANDSVIAELYLRMTCATVYHNSGNDPQAIRHLDRAIELAMPDQLYGLLAEYGRPLDSLLEQRLSLVDPDVWYQVKRLYKIYHDGWAKLSGSVRGRTIVTSLTPREREVAKLAAFGLQNKEIAEKMNMSLSGVKQAVRIVSEKTGMSRDEFAVIL